MPLSHAEHRFLAQVIMRIRDWDEPGLIAAFRRIADLEKPATFGDLAEAATRYANAKTETGSWRWDTPAAMHMPGTHWDGTPAAHRKVPTMCAEHPDRPALKCPECNNRPTATPEQIRAIRLNARRMAANERNTP